jgi:hypothetical protein
LAQAEPLFERNPDFVYRRIVDESVLVPIHRNVADMDCIYTMNPTGAFIWERLEMPSTRAELQAAMLEEYAAEPGALAADLESFLQEMVTIGAVRKV